MKSLDPRPLELPETSARTSTRLGFWALGLLMLLAQSALLLVCWALAVSAIVLIVALSECGR